MSEQIVSSVRNDYAGMTRLLQSSVDNDVSPGSTSAVLNQLLRSARLQLGMEIAFISHFENGHRTFTHVNKAAGLEIVKVGDSDPLTASYCQRVVDGRLPQLMQNAQDYPVALELKITRELGIGGHLSTPITLSDGSVYGTFCCFSFQEDYSLNDRDLGLLQAFAEIAGELLQKGEQFSREYKLKRARIRAILDGDGHNVVWQPIISIASGKVTGVETLSRFSDGVHPGPAEWFAEAVSVGLADELEMRAISKGLDILRTLEGDEYVGCNASAEAILNYQFSDDLRNQPLERMLLEITEHDIVRDYVRLREVLKPLRAAGLRIAIDDAGAGYASLQHILQLQPDVIKLDISLIRDIDINLPKQSLAMAMVMFGKAIGSTLVAEGVETSAEMETLAKLGVDMAQGYYIQRPTSFEKITDFLKACDAVH